MYIHTPCGALSVKFFFEFTIYLSVCGPVRFLLSCHLKRDLNISISLSIYGVQGANLAYITHRWLVTEVGENYDASGSVCLLNVCLIYL